MKKSYLFRTMATLMFAAFSLYACTEEPNDITDTDDPKTEVPDDPNDDPNDDPKEDPNDPVVEIPDAPEYELDHFIVGDTYPIAATVVGGTYKDQLGEEYVQVAATPLVLRENVEMRNIQTQPQFMHLLVHKDLVGVEIDLTKETRTFSVTGVWTDADEQTVEFAQSSILVNGGQSGITAGKALVTDNGDGTYEFTMACYFENAWYGMDVVAEMTENIEDVQTENWIYYGNNHVQAKQAINASFYAFKDNTHEIYLTLSPIYDYNECESISLWYAAIWVPDELADGSVINLANAPENVLMLCMDNANRAGFSATSGTLCVTHLGEGEYQVVVDDAKMITTDDLANGGSRVTDFSCSFSGECISKDYKIEYPSIITYKNEEMGIRSAFLHKESDEVWVAYVSSDLNTDFESVKGSDLTVKISAAPKYFNGSSYGLSSVKESEVPITISYKDEIWTSATEKDALGLPTDRGTIKVLVNGEDSLIEVSNTGHNSILDGTLKVHYEGAITIVE